MLGNSTPLVLLVEDSPDDVDFARRALAKSGVPHQLLVAEHGEEALQLLGGIGPDVPAGGVRPDLILLDLNTPGMSGRELLTVLKRHPRWCTTPVVILSTSTHPADIEGCYRDHANSYHKKSHDFATYQNTMRQIVEYWLGAAIPCRPLGEGAEDRPVTLA